MTSDDLLNRIDQLTLLGNKVLITARRPDPNYQITYVSTSEMTGFQSASLSFIRQVFGTDHPYAEQYQKGTRNHFKEDAETGLAILAVIRDEIAAGWLKSVKSLVSAEVFADFIDMAEHLLETDYKDAAAVMIGSVLKEHLRQLCAKFGVDVEVDRNGKLVRLKADRLNADLVKASAYSALNQKAVTAWLALRNDAAHGNYEAYTKEQVEQMRSGVVDFMLRIPS